MCVRKHASICVEGLVGKRWWRNFFFVGGGGGIAMSFLGSPNNNQNNGSWTSSMISTEYVL
jgi:hypothetical protein